MALLLGSAATGFVLIVLAVIRIGRVAPWRDLVRVAVATGSLTACIEFFRYCERS
jgi:hypothetical protein